MCGFALALVGVPVDCACIPPPEAGETHAQRADSAAAPAGLCAFAAGLRRRGPDATEQASVDVGASAQLLLCATLLQLRGDAPGAALQRGDDGTLLAFNGEVFGGVPVSAAENDSAVLLRALCDEHADVAAVLSSVRGPWSLAFWHAPTRTLWFGRDVLGRRSLLLRRPDNADPRLVLTSVAPAQEDAPVCWEELPPGLYSVHMDCGVVQKHAWRAAELLDLAAYSRQTGTPATAVRSHADELLSRLDAAVARRVARACSVRNAQPASVLVLFSGGVDSALLAALAHRHVAAGEAIDLANVCFNGGASADRQAARAALCELRALAPQRTWRLIEVDGTLELVAAQRAHLLQLLHPRDTVMDLNIGSALWLAARAEGVCDGAPCTSAARIVLLGTGADEQAAGYSRHRASFNRGGDAALVAELEADVRRLWLRNLGRDDRLISDCGREARFPFLDEAVMACLAQVPLCELADLRRPPGCGDKLLIRAAARALGLDGAAQRVKRAIQFGSGLSRLASVQAHGSGRAANARGGGKCSVNAS